MGTNASGEEAVSAVLSQSSLSRVLFTIIGLGLDPPVLTLYSRSLPVTVAVPGWSTFLIPVNVNGARRSGQSVTASDFGSNGPRFESGRGRCVESLDKALYSHCPKEKPSH